MKIGLLFGSFNPIHNGHIAIAKNVLKSGLVDKVLCIVAKQNPFKQKYQTSFARRQQMAEIAISTLLDLGYNIEVSSIESQMDDSRTYNVLENIKQVYGLDNEYIIICGDDMFDQIHMWYKGDKILNNYSFIVYSRNHANPIKAPNVTPISLPDIADISSSNIRNIIASSSDNTRLIEKLQYVMNSRVLQYILMFNLYR